jgi:spermidine synthase
LVETIESPINGKVTVYYIYGKYLLETANGNYSYGNLHKGFQKAFRTEKIQEKNFKKVLLLGLGAGSVVSILQEELKKDCYVTAIELDPLIIDLGKKYFNTGRFKNLEVHMVDAADFVSKCTDKFDLVAFDIYIDNDVPDHIETIEFLANLKRLLSEEGILVYNKNLHSTAMQQSLPGFLKIFREIFPGFKTVKAGEKSKFLFYYS